MSSSSKKKFGASKAKSSLMTHPVENKETDAQKSNEPPHWIHHTVKDLSSIDGIFYLPECECSVCGYVSNMEKDVCPHCGSKMVRSN